MKTIFQSMILCWLVSACSTMDTNYVKRSVHHVKGGKSRTSEWKEELTFKRTSWYYQASLLYEINIAQIAPDSAFLNWFDDGELSSVKGCKQLLWVIDYAYDGRRVQKNYVKNILSNKGFVDISAPNFEKNFINHPDTPLMTNRNYKMQLFCHQSTTMNEIYATIPGFNEEKIEL